MENTPKIDRFFSVPDQMIVVNSSIPYDLYINSSRVQGREKYIRIFPQNEILGEDQLKSFRNKYFQIYVHEDQRNLYLNGIVKLKGVSETEKTRVIKNAALEYLDNLFNPSNEITAESLENTVQSCKEVISSMVDVIETSGIEDIKEMIGELSFHDFYTYDHSINVSMYCISFLKYLRPQSSRDELILIGLGGLLHDLGKIGIPTEILNKATKLSDEEFNKIKAHPHLGHTLLLEKNIQCSGVDMVLLARIINEHHENFNGTGYPSNLKGEEIHQYARITAICDFFDAITTKRSYHEAISMQEAINVMSGTVNKKIDPELFKLFTQSVKILPQRGKSEVSKTLDESFDPCQPHQELDFCELKKEKEKQQFGKIHIK